MIVPGSPAAIAALKGLAYELRKKVWDKKVVGQLYELTPTNKVEAKSDALVTLPTKPKTAESDEIYQWLIDQGLEENDIWAAQFHPDTRLAWFMRKSGIKSAKLLIVDKVKDREKPLDVCRACRIAIRQILPADGGMMTVVFIDGNDTFLPQEPIIGQGPPLDVAGPPAGP